MSTTTNIADLVTALEEGCNLIEASERLAGLLLSYAVHELVGQDLGGVYFQDVAPGVYAVVTAGNAEITPRYVSQAARMGLL